MSNHETDDASGIETESSSLLRCTKCDAPLAATEADKDGFEIPLCRDCYQEEMAQFDREDG